MLGPSDRPGRISIPCADAAVAPMSMMESARAMCFKGSPPQDCLVARCRHLKFNFVPLIQNNMTRTISGKIFGISFGRHLLGSTLRNTGTREDRQPGGLATQHASCDTNNMSGWLMQAIYPRNVTGNGEDSRDVGRLGFGPGGGCGRTRGSGRGQRSS